MAGRTPNVLFITADQFRGDCLGAAGHPVVRTPALDALAAGGVSFRRHFANAVPCAPSRASLYTGMYLMNHRGATNGTPLDARHDNVALMARRLGYQPALFGYTDTGIDPRTCEADDPRLFSYEGVLPGFEPVCHLAEGAPDDWLAWLRKGGVDVPDDWRSFANEPAPGTKWRTQYSAEQSQTAYLTDRVLDYIEGRESWFVHLSYLRPHPPYLAPAPYDTMYSPSDVPAPVRAPTMEAEGEQHPLLGVMLVHPMLSSPVDEQEQREFQATYYGMITEVDDQLARLFDAIDLDNTVVVFTSDHGELLGDHWLVQKIGWFDTAYHVPLIVRAPGVDARVVDVMSEHVDVLPTIADLLGASVPTQCDGRSLMPWLRGETVHGWRNEVRHEMDLRDPASTFLEEAFGVTLEECSLAVLRDDHGKYVQFAGHHVFPAIFFDLDDDPAQLVNRASDPAYAPKVLEYAQRMLAWRMRHAERTLTGMKLTGHAGLVERHAPRS
ncbi:MAG TPA: alkaline phosphatase family protein [Acidimicrobiia bacterium]|nr:alkaline phosphatase family protein [Acidimicrobiia bacterium]